MNLSFHVELKRKIKWSVRVLLFNWRVFFICWFFFKLFLVLKIKFFVTVSSVFLSSYSQKIPIACPQHKQSQNHISLYEFSYVLPLLYVRVLSIRFCMSLLLEVLSVRMILVVKNSHECMSEMDTKNETRNFCVNIF